MAKDSFYFSHDFNARNDEKILELRANYGAEAYGVFWMVVETMAETDNGGVKVSLIGGLSLGYGVPKERLKDILNFCVEIGLFYEEDGFIFSRRIIKYKEFRNFFAEKGREGAEKRWKNRGANGEAYSKERKGKESKDIKGVEYSEDGTKVLLSDGTYQDLGKGQFVDVKFGLKPEKIIKGVIT